MPLLATYTCPLLRCVSPQMALSGHAAMLGQLSAFGSKADIHDHVASTASVAHDLSGPLLLRCTGLTCYT